jgi:hypothetical protein
MVTGITRISSLHLSMHNKVRFINCQFSPKLVHSNENAN